MAEFCGIDDVRRYNTHRVYDSESHPTEDQVETFVGLANAALTAVLLGADYSAIEDVDFASTYPDAWSVLQEIAGLEAAAMAEQSATALENTTEESGHVRMLLRQRKEKLTLVLEKGLPGLREGVPGTPSGQYYEMRNDEDEDRFLFTRGETF